MYLVVQERGVVVALVLFAEVVHAVLAVVLQVQVPARDPD